MTDESDRHDTLRARVANAVAIGMLERGWRAGYEGPRVITPATARFYRALPGGDQRFVLTAAFAYIDGPSRRCSEAIAVDAFVGVTVPAVERLLMMVGASNRNASVERTIDELGGAGPVAVSAGTEIGAAVQWLTGFVEEHVGSVEGLANVDAWLGDLQADSDARDYEIEIVPAALAVFGRAADAREALARFADETARAEYHAFADRLTAFIDSGAEPPQPSAAPSAASDSGRERAMGPVERTRRRRSALQAVERAPQGASAQERRALLENALEREGLSERPGWIESHLSAERRGSWRAVLTLARDVAVTAFRARHGDLPQDPQFLAPPARAVDLSVQSSGRWVAATLDADADAFLASVYRAATRRLGPAVLLKPCLQVTPSVADAGASVTVMIGEQRIGSLRRDELSADPAALGELVCTRGRLTRLAGERGYLFEIAEPVIAAGANGKAGAA